MDGWMDGLHNIISHNNAVIDGIEDGLA